MIVCTCVCVRACWTKHTLTDPGGGFSVSLTPVGDGSSCPDLKEQTQLRPFLTHKKKQLQEEKKNKKKKNCLQENKLFRLCTPWCFYRRTATPLTTLHGHRECIYFGENSLPPMSVWLFFFSFHATVYVWWSSSNCNLAWGVFYLRSFVFNEGV